MKRPPPFIVITDLDGTLLDQESYSYEGSLPAIEKLREIYAALILCSSKTRSEVGCLWQELKLSDPFIVENGGAIYFPPQYFPFSIPGLKSKGPFEAMELGTSVVILRKALEEATRKCGVSIKSFGAMGLDEISSLTGLSSERTSLAAQREYDEPFLVEAGEGGKLCAALRAKGLTLTQGDRFLHLTGGHDKGQAVRILLDLYRQSDPGLFSVGLGNSANDLPLFIQVDRPVLIRNPNGSFDPEVEKKFPAIERTQGVGPYGWREAVEKIFTGSA